MNNSKIKEILKDHLVFENTIVSDEVTSATTNLQLADEHSICFYHITDLPNSNQLFLDRLKESNCRNLILSKHVEVEGVNVWVIDHKDFLKAQEAIANCLYPNDGSLKIAGITGTNGKTTVSYLAMQMATSLGFPSISIGTIGIRSSKEILEDDILSTTPSYLELRKIINKYQKEYKFIFMEVSSHALAQSRLYSTELECCAWTSFSQDHLDYHKDYEDYFNAKLKIVKNSKNKNIIVPAIEDDLISMLKRSGNLVDPVSCEYSSEFDVGFKATYNQANLAVAKRMVELISGQVVGRDILKSLTLPAGRFESIQFKDNIVIVDYAHTPDALENICETIKKDFSSFHLVVVFGCGGDRDKSKRPLMGEAVAKYADSIIVTSDNPRTENPEKIIEDILPGITTPFEQEVDRRKAIQLSLKNITSKSVVLIAGKGHEEYQDVMGKKTHFSDKEEVLKYIKESENV